MRFRLPIGLGLAGVLALAGAAGAQAAPSQSMVYIQNGNVFIANADGSNPHQVTKDGTTTVSGPLSDPSSQSQAYHSPTEANDGTIWAPNGFAIYHLNQNGTLIKEVVPPGGEYALAAAVSPDDSKVAYNWDIPAVGYGGLGGQTGASVITASGAASSYPDATRVFDASWLSDSSTVIYGTDKSGDNEVTDVDYQTPGQAEVKWFDPEDPLGAGRGTGFSSSNETFYSNQPVVDPTGTYLAVVEKSSYSRNAHPTQLQIFKLNGGPPAAPTLVCDYETTDPDGFLNPSWNGDATKLAYYDSTGEQLLDTTAISTCPTPQETTLANVSQASFGPAPNAPAPLPPTTTTTTTTKTTTTGPGPGPAPVTFSAASLTIAKSLKRAALLKSGVRTTLRCNATCAYAVALGVTNPTARALGLTRKKKGSVAIGAKRGTLAGGKTTVAVKLNAKAARALKRSRLRTVKLIVAVAAQGKDGKRVDHTYGVTVKR